MVAALVVGQEINLDTGLTDLRGKVVKITLRSVYVQQIWENQRGEIVGGEIIRFDKEGIQCGAEPLSLIGPLEIDEVPFAERKQTLRERRAREYQPFIEWWKSAPYEQRLALVTKCFATLAPSLRPISIVGSPVSAETIANADISLDSFLMTELAKEKLKS